MKETKYMSKEYTNCLRGIFAILVVIHHIYQHTGLLRGTYLGIPFQLLGFLSVAMFFFFSGYGLMFSAGKEKYIDHFFVKRFLPLYCFYVLAIVIYSLWTLLIEKSFSVSLLIQSFFFGDTVVVNGWYLQTIFLVYLLYLVVFKIFKTAKIQMVMFSIGIVAYCIVCILLNMGINWYQTIPCVVFGMVYCNRKAFFDGLLKKRAWLIFVLSGILFAVCYIISAIGNIAVIFNMLYCLFFVCAVITLSYILRNTSLINNKFLKVCGMYSLEIYVTHGLFLKLFTLKYIENILLYILVVILGTVVMSLIMKTVYTMIVSILNPKA